MRHPVLTFYLTLLACPSRYLHLQPPLLASSIAIEISKMYETDVFSMLGFQESLNITWMNEIIMDSFLRSQIKIDKHLKMTHMSPEWSSMHKNRPPWRLEANWDSHNNFLCFWGDFVRKSFASTDMIFEIWETAQNGLHAISKGYFQNGRICPPMQGELEQDLFKRNVD